MGLNSPLTERRRAEASAILIPDWLMYLFAFCLGLLWISSPIKWVQLGGALWYMLIGAALRDLYLKRTATKNGKIPNLHE